MLTRQIVIIISQCIQILIYYVVHLKLIQSLCYLYPNCFKFFRRKEEPSEFHRSEAQVLISMCLKSTSFRISCRVRQTISLLFKLVESMLSVPDNEVILNSMLWFYKI